jgi:hypothetical protein
MGLVVLPYTFINNTVADATEVNANFTAITAVVNGSINAANLAATLTFSNLDFVDLASIVHGTTALQGLRLPQIGATPASPASGEGFIGWDQTNDTLEIYDGAAWVSITPAYGTPALTLSTTNDEGTAASAIRTDATIALFDATDPSTQAFGDSAATGSAAIAARRDHKHGMPTISNVWTLVSSTSFASAETATVSGLDGNTDEMYLVIYRFKVANVNASGVSEFRPNNLTTDQYGFYGIRGTNAAADAAQTNDGFEIASFTTAGDDIYGVMYFSTRTNTDQFSKGQMAYGWSTYRPNGGGLDLFTYFYTWDVNTNLTSLVLWANGAADTITGNIWVYKQTNP